MLSLPCPLHAPHENTTHHGGGAQPSHYEDLCPKDIESFHKQAFAAGYEVRRRETQALGAHYAAIDPDQPLKVLGIFPCHNYPGRGRPSKTFTPMLIVPVL